MKILVFYLPAVRTNGKAAETWSWPLTSS